MKLYSQLFMAAKTTNYRHWKFQEELCWVSWSYRNICRVDIDERIQSATFIFKSVRWQRLSLETCFCERAIQSFRQTGFILKEKKESNLQSWDSSSLNKVLWIHGTSKIRNHGKFRFIPNYAVWGRNIQEQNQQPVIAKCKKETSQDFYVGHLHMNIKR